MAEDFPKLVAEFNASLHPATGGDSLTEDLNVYYQVCELPVYESKSEFH